MRTLMIATASFALTLPGLAQQAMPAVGATPFKDTSVFKPPVGSKLAIVEFEDLECYACGQASPIVHAAMQQYGIPLVHHDFLIPSHVWSRSAAITARYLEDKVSPKLAQDFRRDIFAHQASISAPEDLQNFTSRWFQTHNLQLPFVIDGSGRCAEEVQADCLLGVKLGVRHTPTIIVVTPNRWIEVTDPRVLYAALDQAKASLVTPDKPRPRR